ncbi:MAG: hypothetical protein ACRDYZ_04305, partial [Acidimicrobiales bacterium]
MAAGGTTTGQLPGGGRSPAVRGPGGPVGVAGAVGHTGDPAAGAAEPDGEGKKKSKKKKVLILVAVLLLLGAGYMVKGRSHKVVYKPGQPVPAGKVSSLGTL